MTDERSTYRTSEQRCRETEAELARVRAERDSLKAWQQAYAKGRAGMVEQADQDFARAEAAEARAENQAAEIVALLRSYANVHMTKALADLIEHKYVHGEERSA